MYSKLYMRLLNAAGKMDKRGKHYTCLVRLGAAWQYWWTTRGEDKYPVEIQY